MKAIINAELIMKDHLIPEAVLFIEDGKIAGYGEMRNTPIPEGCEIIDAKGLYVGPGLVDIHCHSGSGVYFRDDPVKAMEQHKACGTTSVLATPSTRAPEPAAYVEQIGKIRKAMELENSIIAGIYMEGPYINANFGSVMTKPGPGMPRVFEIDPAEYEPLFEAGADIIRVWGTAPERENIEQFVKAAKKANPEFRFAVTHSEATPQQIEALMPYGLCIGTHHTNATGDRIFYPEVRGVCVDETVNYNRDIYAEMICDSRGIHVDPYMQRLIRKIKGEDRLILISDACVFDGPIPDGYDGVTDLCFDFAGEIAGSKLSLDVACRNMMKHTGASIVDVFRYASYNPSRAIGFLDRGEIAVGKRADLVIVDHWMKVNKVFFKGELQ